MAVVATIHEIVRNVVLTVVVAGLVEMLLPSGQMNRYVKLVAGLFIIAAILAPLTKQIEQLSRTGAATALAAWQGLPTTDKGMADATLSLTARQYAARVEKQIEQILELLPGVDKAEVRADAQTGSANQLSLAQIQIRLWVTDASSPDTITRQQVESVVSNFYLIDPKLVEVEILGNK
ncbi:MAG: stage III sporulation protein AF [Clostridia bacterium]|nr:stage III sporulation protein AF [Clostridia bacterium]